MPIDLPMELTNLRRQILSMGASVEHRLNVAVDALVSHDAKKAQEVRHGDSEIDQMEIDIEEECLKILALTHPVAGDLRFVLAVMRINNDLERIGDHAKSIAKRVIDLKTLSPVALPEPLVEMGQRTRRMFGEALQALADEDVARARKVRQADQRVDDLQKEVFTWVQEEIHRNVEITEAAIDMLSVARNMERVADMATNIAEDVVFLSEGAVIRHSEIEA